MKTDVLKVRWCKLAQGRPLASWKCRYCGDTDNLNSSLVTRIQGRDNNLPKYLTKHCKNETACLLWKRQAIPAPLIQMLFLTLWLLRILQFRNTLTQDFCCDNPPNCRACRQKLNRAHDLGTKQSAQQCNLSVEIFETRQNSCEPSIPQRSKSRRGW
ncbi:hypothetical protein BD769DRAFT_1496140 [Suillus cothurnatus]|nr:hypothetical protein BD769DRAFT_1496140 [Suillus cothurnatus]